MSWQLMILNDNNEWVIHEESASYQVIKDLADEKAVFGYKIRIALHVVTEVK